MARYCPSGSGSLRIQYWHISSCPALLIEESMSPITETPRLSGEMIELPQARPPAIRLWAENYIYEVTCPQAGASFLLHLGRQPFDTDLWRDTMVADSGGDEVYLWRGFGKGSGPAGPGGSQLKFFCDEPFKRWTLRFDGAAQRVPRREVMPGAGGALRDGPIVPMRLCLEAVADGPVWDIGRSVGTHEWGKAHYQQSVRIVGGEWVLDGVSTAVEGVATRDHTRGPRDFSSLGSYAWIHGGFPGGRRFITLALNPRPGFTQPPVRMGIVSSGDHLTPVEIVETAIPETRDGGPDRYTLRLKGPQGVEIIEAERLSSVVLGVGAPNHLMLGPSVDPSCVAHMFPSPTRFTWNGEICYGFSERSVALA
jgi:hypothetical protein